MSFLLAIRSVSFPARIFAFPVLTLTLAGAASGQAFVESPGQIPQGNPFNDSFTEAVDFADIDHDGDLDAVWADGGDCCSDQNRLWVNQGGLQGGTIGFFLDKTSTQFPAVQNDGRDVDFTDIDLDGDQDLYFSATSANGNQTNRWWVNMGGLQGGTAGFFADQTALRWLNIAGPGSSVATSMKLASGGFVDWSCDCVFGDFDNDGHIDLMHSTYGGIFGGDVPSRIFLNNGQGFYAEFNPPGFQLSGSDIHDGDPALWCQGLHKDTTTNSTGVEADISDTPLGVELGDMDADHDIDILHGARNEIPRIFHNRLAEQGTLAFRDVTFAVQAQTGTSIGKYEQELGDLDNDGDLDIYGLNWSTPQLTDVIVKNDGAGNYGAFILLPASNNDDNEGDFLDYNNDNNLDLFISAFFAGVRIYKNSGPPNFDLVHMPGDVPSVPNIALAADAGDIDNDGDVDIFVAIDAGGANVLLKNITQVDDQIAPRLVNLELSPDRLPGPDPTVVRIDVFDNGPWYMTAFDTVLLQYNVNGGSVTSTPMVYSGGQTFRGEIPGNLTGTICYFVEARDREQNTGTSPSDCYVAMPPCSGSVSTFCTAKAGLACGLPVISATGLPSASANSGFVIQSSPARANRLGVLLYNTQKSASPQAFQGGTLCLLLQNLRRGGPTDSLGTPGQCDGNFAIDMNAFAHGLWVVPGSSGLTQNNPAGYLLVPGTTVHCQYWGRDTFQTGNHVSDGLSFTICP